MNRFDQPIGNREQFISTYAPMPLEAFTRLAMTKQSQYNSALDDLEKSKGLLSVKADPDAEPYRDKWVGKRSKELGTFADRAVKEGWTPSLNAEYIKWKNEVINDPDRLTMERRHEDYYKRYLPDKQTQVKNRKYIGDLDEYPTLKSSPDQLTPWYYQGLEELQDYDDTAKKIVGPIKPSGDDRKWFNLDESGNIISIKKGSEGVAGDYLRKISRTKVIDYAKTPAGGQLLDVYLRKNPNATDEELSKYLEDQMVRSNLNQLFSKTDNEQSFSYGPKDIRDKKAIEEGSLGQTVPGSVEHNLTLEVPEPLRGVVSYNNGKATIDYDKKRFVTDYKVYNKHGREVATYDKYEDAVKYSREIGGTMELHNTNKVRGLSDKDHADLANYVANAAKAIGYKGEIKASDYSKILTEYNKAAKSISYDSKLTDVERRIIKNDMLADRTNYVYRDANGNPIEAEAITNATFNPNTRVYGADGKSRIQFTITDKEGKVIKTGIAESLSQEDTAYHSVIGNLQKEELDYYKTGTTPYKGSVKDKDVPNNKIISVQQSPDGVSKYIVYADPNNRKQHYYLEERDGKLYRINNLSELKKLINKNWYQTPEGKAEAVILANKMTQYEDTQD
jgi:hypothetical protein